MSIPAPHSQASAPGQIFRAFTTLAGGEVVARIAAFAAVAVLARRLGPEGFGVIGFALAVCGYLSLAVNSGLHDVGTREIARAPTRAADIYASVAITRVLLACAAMAVLVIVTLFLPKPPTVRLVVVLTGLSFFSFAVDPSWVFKGLERPTLVAVSMVFAQVLYAAGILLVIHGPADVVRVPVVQFLGELLAVVPLCILVLWHSRPKVTLAAGLHVLRSSGYLGLARALRTVIITLDVVMLGFLASNREVGLYSAAYRIAFLLMAVAASISTAYLPSYARVAATGANPTRRLIELSLRMAVSVGAPLVAGAFVVAQPLLTLLFGPEYQAATLAFRLLALSVGAVFLHWTVSNLLIVTHRTGTQATLYGIAAAVNLVLNVLLIPRFGIVGAAAATLAAELTIAAGGVLLLWQMRVLPSPAPLLRPIGAALGMSVILTATPSLPLAAQITIGGIVYLTALVLVGGVPVATVREILLVARRGGSAS